MFGTVYLTNVKSFVSFCFVYVYTLGDSSLSVYALLCVYILFKYYYLCNNFIGIFFHTFATSLAFNNNNNNRKLFLFFSCLIKAFTIFIFHLTKIKICYFPLSVCRFLDFVGWQNVATISHTTHQKKKNQITHLQCYAAAHHTT